MHAVSCGGDIKWRNIIVRSHASERNSAELSSLQDSLFQNVANQRALVILDFSNACFPLQNDSREEPQIDLDPGVLSTGELELKRQEELNVAQNMINHGRLSNRQATYTAR
jgi:hypothetical protein